MIFIAGAGGMAHAAKALRKMQKRLDDRIAQTRRRARNRVVDAREYETQYTDFACKFLCPTCGYFLDDASSDPCPACGETNWVDLSVEPLADRIREVEAEERNETPAWVQWLVVGAGFLVVAALAIPFLFLFVDLSGYVVYAFFLAATLGIPVAIYVLPRPLSVWLLRGRKRLPARWHEPMPLPAEGEEPTRTIRGTNAEPADSSIEAPISGRECIAYQLCIMFDVAGDARPPEWVLQEQRCSRARFGGDEGATIDDFFLESPVAFVGALADAAVPSLLPDREARFDIDPEAIRTFMRQRGLFVSEGDYHFYEACLEPGDEIDVEVYPDDTYVVRHTATRDQRELPELPTVSSTTRR